MGLTNGFGALTAGVSKGFGGLTMNYGGLTTISGTSGVTMASRWHIRHALGLRRRLTMPHVDIELVSSLESLCRGEAQSLSQNVGEVVLLGAVTRPMCRAATYAAAPRQLEETPEEAPP